ncbi:hypothetical protein CTRI78_v003026 [Colletotrichum trifolii]|uniref:Uncharacterized protein n=1 Tax=Colletotrichum trifolii TaxID=5466 RepID=A0A4R8RWJ2_COLTR|nr:hypothetical protein CTRI78_v003026 [Colletotrichum trifolii]
MLRPLRPLVLGTLGHRRTAKPARDKTEMRRHETGTSLQADADSAQESTPGHDHVVVGKELAERARVGQWKLEGGAHDLQSHTLGCNYY